MRILQVIDTLAIGGAEKVFVDLTNLLYEQKKEVSALFLLQPGILSTQLHSGIHRHVLNRCYKWSLIKMGQCASIISQYDIVHCHHRYVYAYVNLCAIFFHVQVKIILHDHYGPIDLYQQVPGNISGVFKPKYFVGVSDKLTNWAKERLKVKPDNIFLLPNIVRSHSQNENKVQKYDWILVSNIKPVKNQLFAVKLAQKMNKSLLIVGNIQDPAYYQTLQAAIADRGVRVTIKTGVAEVRPLLAKVSIGLHVSKSETGPLALIEYLSMGLPFVAYQTGEVAETINSVFPEMLVSNFDIPQWEAAIKLIESSNKASYHKAIKNFYEANFSEKQYLKKCLEIYQKIK